MNGMDGGSMGMFLMIVSFVVLVGILTLVPNVERVLMLINLGYVIKEIDPTINGI